MKHTLLQRKNKDKGISDLILEEQFQDVLKTRFRIQYGDTESTKI